MKQNKSPKQQNSQQSNQSYKQLSDIKQKISFEAIIKRETKFIENWKIRNCIIVFEPNQQFSMTIKKPEKDTIEQIINIHLVKLSKRCLTVQKHFCFGIQLSDKKKYLIGGENEGKVISAFETINQIKTQLKQKIKKSLGKEKISKKQTKIVKQQFIKQELEFQRSNQSEQIIKNLTQQDKKPSNFISTNYSPINNFQYQREFERQSVLVLEQNVNDDDFRTVWDGQPLIVQQKQDKLHLKIPLSPQQLQFLESDQDFKLIQSFSEGRILTHKEQLVKVHILLKTKFTDQQILESFFHLQLWNQQFKTYKLINRIDQGIYLIYVEFKKKNFFSSPRHCYMMITSTIINNEPHLILNSLKQQDFQQKKGYQWVNISIWLKLKGYESEKLKKLVTVCLKTSKNNNFQLILSIAQQIKFFQSFLLTTIKMPHRILQWRKQSDSQICQ